MSEVVRYHFTTLSNFAYGYERYSRTYNKDHIPHSRFPHKFFLLRENEIAPGIEKAKRLLKKLSIEGDYVIALKTKVQTEVLHENVDTNIGEFVLGSSIVLDEVCRLHEDASMTAMLFEDAYCEALRLVRPFLPAWHEIAPRSVSVLPIARGCQAACPFCFSEASVSLEVKRNLLTDERTDHIFARAKEKGAERAVITGGGEPGMLPFSKLQALIKHASEYYPKVVLITNGYFLSQREDSEREEALLALHDSGLTVLAISRHHYDPKTNARLMSLDTQSEKVSASLAAIRPQVPGLQLRWICVLQKNGIESKEDVFSYVEYAASHGVDSICYKELYVSSHIESYYHNEASNQFSKHNQVPLSLVLDVAEERGWNKVSELPWGAPVYESFEFGTPVTIAAYTEPNTTWELSNGMCRSWNLMADGSCYASLEDVQSIVEAL